MPVESRKNAAAPGAVAFLVVAVVLVVVLGWLLVRELAKIDLAPDAEPPAAVEGDVAPAAADDAEAARDVATDAEPAPDGASDAAAALPAADPRRAFDRTVGECVPSLRGLSEGVRLLAVDASPSNVDFVVESANLPGRFVRVGCAWNQGSYALYDAGRMIVPPMVGDPAALPRVLLDPERLTPAWYGARIAAAQRVLDAAAEVGRVEISFVAGHGVLTRVRFDGGRDVILASDDRPKPASTPFPQVERLTDMSPDAANRGYRDTGTTNWSVGVADTLEQMRTRFFVGEQRFRGIVILHVAIQAAQPSRKPGTVRHVVIDAQGDRFESEVSADSVHCAKPFTLAEARAALDRTLRARERTLEAFEAIDFESARFDCLTTREAAWTFDPPL
jgi:hypothetical protein